MKKNYWFNAVGQILLIFIGVTVAIWFENWNDERKKDQQAVIFLQEIKKGLESDLGDMKGNLRRSNEQKNSSEIILKVLESKSVYHDSLSEHFARLPVYSFFNSNRSGYETLKSSGLDLITNDTLRQQIVSVYGHDYRLLDESAKLAYNYSLETLFPSYSKNFSNFNLAYFSEKPSANPLDFKALKNNNEFIQQIRLLRSFKIIEISVNTNAISTVEKLISNLERELSM